MIISGCCVTLDNILTYILKQKGALLRISLTAELIIIIIYSPSNIPSKENATSIGAWNKYVFRSYRATSRNLAANTLYITKRCHF